MAQIPTDIPRELTAGDTWRWTRSFAGYPAGDGWALTYYLRGAGKLDVVAAAAGDAFAVTVPAADTGKLGAGSYQFLARVAKDGEVYTVDAGSVTVLADVSAANEGDLQSHEERMIPILETAIRTRVAADLKSYTILGRSATKEELRDYREMLASARTRVAMKRYGGRLPSVEVHIGRA